MTVSTHVNLQIDAYVLVLQVFVPHIRAPARDILGDNDRSQV